MSTALPTIVLSEPPTEPMGAIVGGPAVTVGLTTAANDVLGLAGDGEVGFNVSGGRNLEEERMGERVDVDEEALVEMLSDVRAPSLVDDVI